MNTAGVIALVVGVPIVGTFAYLMTKSKGKANVEAYDTYKQVYNNDLPKYTDKLRREEDDNDYGEVTQKTFRPMSMVAGKSRRKKNKKRSSKRRRK